MRKRTRLEGGRNVTSHYTTTGYALKPLWCHDHFPRLPLRSHLQATALHFMIHVFAFLKKKKMGSSTSSSQNLHAFIFFSSFPIWNVENKWAVFFYGLRQICFSHWLQFLQRIKQCWQESKLSHWGDSIDAEQTLRFNTITDLQLSELIWSICWSTSLANEQINRIGVFTRLPDDQSCSFHSVITTPQMARTVSKRYRF